MLKATVISGRDVDRLFINDVEFPWPLNPEMGIDSWRHHETGKKVLSLEVLVDEVSYREAPSD
ncbi:hypothetical protein ACFP2T_35800 [Plantactinospora solaniradicis]|uniref:Uncharacterized protein n=1 Tax=Plantactinospora solaniradicis TaxID=1723736 RepID=A0ABW1KID6_9ACTN